MLIVFLRSFSTVNFNNNISSQEVQRDGWLQCTELQEQFGADCRMFHIPKDPVRQAVSSAGRLDDRTIKGLPQLPSVRGL